MLPQLITKYECKGCQSIYMNQGELDHHTSRCITVAAKNHTMMSSKPTAPSTAGTLSRINKYSFKTLEKKQTALKDGGVSRGRMLSSSPDSQMTETQSSTVLSTVIKVEDPSTLLDLTNIKDSEPCELMMTDVTGCVPATELPVSVEVLVPETPSTPITTDRGEDRSVLSTLAVSRVSGTLSDSEVLSSKKCTNTPSKTETRQEALATPEALFF
ncbi:uncharacterized protein [Watersipora subatra]|uniref:uncharacterized protein isoform X3 n=1 Tax=Watersipora subatra TaxID=2589382 RepID=UPI00355BCDE5